MNAGKTHPSPEGSRLTWGIAPWFQPIWYPYVAFCWWQIGAVEVAQSGLATRSPMEPGLAAALAAAAKLSGFFIETAFYRLFWKSWGRALPFWRFFCIVVSASMADVLAHAAGDLVRQHPGSLEVWLGPFAGLQLMRGTIFRSIPALRAAFGTVGILTAARLILTAQAQAQALGIRFRAAFAWSGVVWLLTRIMILWIVDLMKGMSPVPTG